MAKIGIIGAGLAGLVVARNLDKEHEVTVFEKSRGVGGRMATRYAGDFEFDHGAQFFTARSSAFRDFLRPLIDAGFACTWNAQFAELNRKSITAIRPWNDAFPHYVGVPRMTSIGKSLAQDLVLRLDTPVARLDRCTAGWQLVDAQDSPLGRFDWVVLAVPAAQAATLIPEDCALRKIADAAQMRGCYALMLGLRRPLDLAWQAALIHDTDISWISVNSSKPGRGEPFTLVVHSTNDWADRHIEERTDRVRDHLLAEASAVIGSDLERAEHISLQRWRYANIGVQQGPACWADADLRLAACGDWFCRGRVEAAFTSADALATALRAWLQ